MLWTILFSVLLVAALIYLIFFLRKKNRKLDEELEKSKQRILFYRNSLEKISQKNPSQKELEELDKLARDFFNEKFNLKYNLTYLELAKEFKETNNLKESEFCRQMSFLLFSGKKIKSKEIKDVIDEFEGIIHSSLGIE